ncbi:Crp/Fnr family transcriptional regulator [Paenibacillus alvei]|uniref:Crp/Fnr family transcriptional regulator n=1 Tax=Paenibacillus alvei TaxID=44250 RepID=UPI000385DEEE|nr:Crp/Fnr family transcriptional regulator [Paenibacillus alvei]EPY09840.1 cyclic nucleotide-binding protein [Paenibacillus alvei A6-6i-x]
MKELLVKYMAKYTSLTEEEQRAVLEDIYLEEYKKGTVLLRQGDVPTNCYFVLQGCVRQYLIHESGKEVTINFYTEEQAITSINAHKQDKCSEYTFTCLEDTVLVVGELAVEKDMFRKYGQLESLTRQMVEEKFSQVQDEYAAFIASTPEERFKALLQNRPGLIDRVPQHQLASYLGITPESLSRIKKRVHQDKE